MDGQMKPGVRNALLVLLFVVILVPALKVAVNKYGERLPDWLTNWVNSI